MPNQDRSVGAINLCFDGDCVVPFEAYKNLMEQAKEKEVTVVIANHHDTLDLQIKIELVDKEIKLTNLKYNKLEFEKFKALNGGGEKIVFLLAIHQRTKRK